MSVYLEVRNKPHSHVVNFRKLMCFVHCLPKDGQQYLKMDGERFALKVPGMMIEVMFIAPWLIGFFRCGQRRDGTAHRK